MKMNRFFVWICLVFGLLNGHCNAQTPPVPDAVPPTGLKSLPADELLFNQKIKLIDSTVNLTAATLRIARSWLGSPYVHGTLDHSDEEQLVVNLRQLDCWTYIEASLALALTAKDSLPSFSRYTFYLRQLRYHKGMVDGYGSRLHYFSDWVLQADSLGYVKDITREIGGVPLKKEITYMTDHARLYPKLTDPKQKQQVEAAQKRISAHDWYFIPKKNVLKATEHIKDGDIIILTSSRKDLDVEHQGFAVRGADGYIHLMHASSTGGKVILSTRTLHYYLERLPAMSGIMVLRIVN